MFVTKKYFDESVKSIHTEILSVNLEVVKMQGLISGLDKILATYKDQLDSAVDRLERLQETIVEFDTRNLERDAIILEKLDNPMIQANVVTNDDEKLYREEKALAIEFMKR